MDDVSRGKVYQGCPTRVQHQVPCACDQDAGGLRGPSRRCHLYVQKHDTTLTERPT